MRSAKIRLSIALSALLVSCGGASGTGTDKQPTTSPPPTPVITVSQSSVSASLQAGSAAASYDVTLGAGTAAVVTGISVQDASTPAAPAWLSFTLSQASAPATLTVRVNPASLAAGTYTGALRISATNAAPVTVQVTLVVTAPPARAKLVLEKTAVSVASDIPTPIPSQNIAITSVNGSVGGLSVSSPNCTQAAVPWLTVSLSSATTPATLTLSFKQAGLVILSYSCTFTVATSQAGVDSASQAITVSLVVKNIPRIGLSTDTVRMSASSGQPAGVTSVLVSSSGTAPLPATSLSLGATAYGAGATGWLNASLSGATIALSAPAAGSLALGTYYATVPVQSSATDVANSPRPLVVALTVAPAPPNFVVTPASFTFSFKAGTTPHLTGGFVVTSSVASQIDGVFMLPNPSSGPVLPYLSLNMTYFWACPSVASPLPGVRLTPCELQFAMSPPASLAPGNYSFAFDVSTQTGLAGTSVPVSVTVTP